MELTKITWILATVILLLVSNISSAQQKPQEQLGKVSFPTSCDRKVQPQFDRAVAMLHSFWFQQGEKTFREILERDPSCAIANWGIAAILIGNTFAGKCSQIGKLVLAYDPDRRVRPSDTGNNMIREHPDTQGSFSFGNNNYLEVTSAPFVVPGRS